MHHSYFAPHHRQVKPFSRAALTLFSIARHCIQMLQEDGWKREGIPIGRCVRKCMIRICRRHKKGRACYRIYGGLERERNGKLRLWWNKDIRRFIFGTCAYDSSASLIVAVDDIHLWPTKYNSSLYFSASRYLVSIFACHSGINLRKVVTGLLWYSGAWVVIGFL